MNKRNIDDHLKELRNRGQSSEVTRQMYPKEAERSPDWYQRTRPAAGDRSDWGGSATRGQNWSGGRER
jgi:hypothetical protein